MQYIKECIEGEHELDWYPWSMEYQHSGCDVLLLMLLYWLMVCRLSKMVLIDQSLLYFLLISGRKDCSLRSWRRFRLTGCLSLVILSGEAAIGGSLSVCATVFWLSWNVQRGCADLLAPVMERRPLVPAGVVTERTSADVRRRLGDTVQAVRSLGRAPPVIWVSLCSTSLCGISAIGDSRLGLSACGRRSKRRLVGGTSSWFAGTSSPFGSSPDGIFSTAGRPVPSSAYCCSSAVGTLSPPSAVVPSSDIALVMFLRNRASRRHLGARRAIGGFDLGGWGTNFPGQGPDSACGPVAAGTFGGCGTNFPVKGTRSALQPKPLIRKVSSFKTSSLSCLRWAAWLATTVSSRRNISARRRGPHSIFSRWRNSCRSSSRSLGKKWVL